MATDNLSFCMWLQSHFDELLRNPVRAMPPQPQPPQPVAMDSPPKPLDDLTLFEDAQEWVKQYKSRQKRKYEAKIEAIRQELHHAGR